MKRWSKAENEPDQKSPNVSKACTDFYVKKREVASHVERTHRFADP